MFRKWETSFSEKAAVVSEICNGVFRKFKSVISETCVGVFRKYQWVLSGTYSVVSALSIIDSRSGRIVSACPVGPTVLIINSVVSPILEDYVKIRYSVLSRWFANRHWNHLVAIGGRRCLRCCYCY